MAIEDDIKKQLEQLNKGNSQLVRIMEQMARAGGARIDGKGAVPGEVIGRGGGTTRATKEAEKRAEKLDKVAKEFFSASKDITKEISSTRNAWSKMQNVLKETGGALAGADADFRNFGGGFRMINQQAEKLVEGMGRYSTLIAKTAKSQSLLYAKQIQNLTAASDFEQAAAYDKLAEALEHLDEGAKKALDVIDEATGKIRTDLNFEELSKKRAALGDVLANVAESLSGTGFKSLRGMFAGTRGGTNISEDNKEAIFKAAASLQASGLYSPSRESLSVLDAQGNIKGAEGFNDVFSTHNAPEFLEALAKLTDSLEKSAEKTDKAVFRIMTPLSKFAAVLETQSGRMAMVNKAIDYFMTTAALKKVGDGFKNLYSELMKFNIAQIPATYLNVQRAAVTLGMNFEDASAVFAENKRVLAAVGPKEFQTSLETMKDSLARVGYTMQQGAEAIWPATQTALLAGVNARDANGLQTYSESLFQGFKKLSGVVDVSLKAYMEMNAQLLKSEGSFEILMSMDRARRQAYATELIQLRDKYHVEGLSLQQAQDLVNMQQKQQRDKVGSRVQDAAKLAMLASQQGLDGRSAYRLGMKGKRSASEQAQFMSILTSVTTGMEQRRGAAWDRGMGSGIAADVFAENMSPEFGGLWGAALNKAYANQTGLGLNGKEQSGAAGLATGNTTLTNFGNVVNSVSAVLNNSLTKAALGAGVSLVALMIQSRLLGASFMSLASKFAGMNGLGGAIGAGGGKLGGMLGGALGKGLGLGAILGIGGSVASSALMSSGYTKTGSAVDILGLAGSGVATGAALGSVIPGVGTMIGGAVGGVAGAGYGLYKNWGNFGSPVNSSPTINHPMAEASASSGGINTVGQSTSMPVRDLSSEEKLAQIALHTKGMLDVLQEIRAKEVTVMGQTTKTSVKPAVNYVTGR